MRLIDADELIEEVQDQVDPFVLTFINNAPTVEPERPQGEWVDYNNTFYKCPECGYLLEKCCPQCQTKIILPFCHCGADAQKGDKEK